MAAITADLLRQALLDVSGTCTLILPGGEHVTATGFQRLDLA